MVELRWWRAHRQQPLVARQHSCPTSTEVVAIDTAVINKGLLMVVKRWKWSSGGGRNFVHRDHHIINKCYATPEGRCVVTSTVLISAGATNIQNKGAVVTENQGFSAGCKRLKGDHHSPFLLLDLRHAERDHG
jgi:hypothetical protein